MSNPDYIKIRIPGESMWAIRVGLTSAKVANIPIMTNEFTLGDLVEIDAEHNVVSVLERGAYNMVCHYEYEESNVVDVFKQLKEHFQSHDISVEGGVKGICMLSVPNDCDEERLEAVRIASPVSLEISEPSDE